MIWTHVGCGGGDSGGRTVAGADEPGGPDVAVSDGVAAGSQDNDPGRAAVVAVAADEPSELPGGSARVEGELAEEYARQDPSADGWETESIAATATGALKRLGSLLSEGGRGVAALGSEGVIADRFVAATLRPEGLEEVYAVAGSVVRRPAGSASEWSGDAAGAGSSAGAAGFAEAWSEFVEPLAGAGGIDVAFKLYRIEPGEGTASTRVIVHTSGTHGGRGVAVAQNAEWEVGWELAGGGSAVRIASARPVRYEEVETPAPGGGAGFFTDVTASVLGGDPRYEELLLPGLDHWGARLDQALGLEVVGYQGLALGDVNGDGFEDLYVLQPGGLPNQLFVRQADGTMRDLAAEAGVDWMDKSKSAVFADFDNDGDQDLVVLVDGAAVVMENDGAGRFPGYTLVPLPGIPFSAAAADYDRDGDLDIYVCNYGDLWGGFGELDHRFPFPYHDANNGGPNVLLRNDGLGDDGKVRFTDVTAAVGLDANNTRWSLACAWEDYDNDGDDDLYVANDFGRNNLYRNDGGRFTDVAPSARVEDVSPGMSVTWGDYDRDGNSDVYVSNMFSGAGNRITFQSQFLEGVDSGTKADFQRFARGNALFRNRGDGAFDDLSLDEGVSVGRWAWASRFLDFNNDGWEDIVVANGFLTQSDPDDL